MSALAKGVWCVAVAGAVLGGALGVSDASAQVMGITSGEIVAIDPEHGALKLGQTMLPGDEISAAKTPTTFLVQPDTMISKEDRPVNLEELRVGDQVVELEYITKGEKPVARAIVVQPNR